MKVTIVAAVIVLLTSTANAATYKGSFESEWFFTSSNIMPVTVEVEAESDGSFFQINTMDFQFTTAMDYGLVGSTIDPLAVSVSMAVPSQPLTFIPGSSIAAIQDMQFTWEVQYDMIYREVRSGQTEFHFISVDEVSPSNFEFSRADTVFDFENSEEVVIQFSTNSSWLLAPIPFPRLGIGTRLRVPTAPIILSIVPEPTTAVLALAATLYFAISRRPTR